MRLFIATSFPEPVMRELNARMATVRPRLPSASWARPAAQHLTFAFLGEQDASVIALLAPAIEQRMRGIPSFPATLQGCGFFPNARHPRVGWIGLDPVEPLRNVAAAVRDEVQRAGLPLDAADFKPHLTLMRLRDPWPPASIQLLENALKDFRSAPFVVDAVTLYSSVLNPSGAIHTPLRRFALA